VRGSIGRGVHPISLAQSHYDHHCYSSPTMAHNHHNSTDSLAEKIKRHPKYYLSGGDIHFLVETYLFRVHRYFFERESAYFREKLAVAAPPGQSPKGSSDANPFPLEDVLANDFSRFLWVFYNPKYSIYDATVDDWSAILKLAFDWRFGEVKKLCCRELEKFEIAPMQKIELYQTYELDKKLLIPSYIAMCMRPQPLSIKEGRQLGLETALLIATAREHARGQSASDGTLSPSPVSVEDDDMVNMIKDVFGITAGPPSPSLTPLENTSSASAFTTPSKLTIPNGITSPPRPSLNTMTSLASASATAVNSVFGDGTSQAATVAPAQAAAKDTVKSPGIGTGPTGDARKDAARNAGVANANGKDGNGKDSANGKDTGAKESAGTPTGAKPTDASPATGAANGDGKGKEGQIERGKDGAEGRPETPIDEAGADTGDEWSGPGKKRKGGNKKGGAGGGGQGSGGIAGLFGGKK